MTKPLLIETFHRGERRRRLKKTVTRLPLSIEELTCAQMVVAPGAAAVSFATPRRYGARVDAVLPKRRRRQSGKTDASQLWRGTHRISSIGTARRLAALGRGIGCGSKDATLGFRQTADRAMARANTFIWWALPLASPFTSGVQNAVDATLAKHRSRVTTYPACDGETVINFVRRRIVKWCCTAMTSSLRRSVLRRGAYHPRQPSLSGCHAPSTRRCRPLRGTSAASTAGQTGVHDTTQEMIQSWLGTKAKRHWAQRAPVKLRRALLDEVTSRSNGPASTSVSSMSRNSSRCRECLISP